MFKITEGKGFHITFENGWTVSVQFGGGNYGDNHELILTSDLPYAEINRIAGERGSRTAETWAWNNKRKIGPDPEGYQTPAEVLALMVQVAAMEKE